MAEMLQIETWEQDGEPRSKPVIRINGVQLLGSAKSKVLEEEF